MDIIMTLALSQTGNETHNRDQECSWCGGSQLGRNNRQINSGQRSFSSGKTGDFSYVRTSCKGPAGITYNPHFKEYY